MGNIVNKISCQFGYIQSVFGILKLIELLCDLLSVILGAAAPTIEGNSGHKGFFLFVAVLSLILTLLLLILNLLNINNACMKERWVFIEIGWCIFIALFYFIASIVIATIAKHSGVYGAAAFFGFAAMFTYIADAIYQFRMNKLRSRNDNAQQYAPDMGTRPQPTY